MGVNQKRKDEINKYLSKDNLEKLFNDGYSANYIAKEYFAPYFVSNASTVISKAKVFGIKTFSITESNNLDKVKSQRIKTNLEKYGVKNPSQCKSIKDKKIQSSLDKYGTINVFQAEEIKAKSRKTNLEKYGVPNPAYFCTKNKRISNFQNEVFNRVKSLGFNVDIEVFGKFNKDDYYPVVDIFFLDYPLIIECNGDYFHANPKKYKSGDIIVKYKGKTLVDDIWEADRKRTEQIESFGYKVIVIWETDYRSNRQIVGDLINEAIKDFENSKNQHIK